MKVDDKYKCLICGNVVELKEVGGGTLVCCSKPMELVNTSNVVNPKGDEVKHLPIIDIRGQKEIFVKIGEIPHPMTPEHYIQWIEISVDGSLYTKSLNHWDKPEALFKVFTGKKIAVRAKCNLHGVWKQTI